MIHEEIDQILEQAFKNVMRKSKFFQANRKILRKFLDARKATMHSQGWCGKCGIFCPFSRTEHNGTYVWPGQLYSFIYRIFQNGVDSK